MALQGHGSDSQWMHEQIKCITWLQCMLLWVNASTKSLNVRCFEDIFVFFSIVMLGYYLISDVNGSSSKTMFNIII